ncbi:Rai14, partial [Symbiodinium sp. CCMP2456]
MRPSRPALAVSTSASAEDASVHHRLAQLEEEVAQLRADNARLNEALLQLGTENEMCQSSVGFVRQPGASPPDRRTQRLGGPTPPVTDLELSEEPAESVRALRRWETWKFLKDFTEFLEQQPTLGSATGRLPPSQCPDLVSAERRLRLSTVAEGQHAPPVGGNQWFGEARRDYDFPQGSGLDFALSGGSSSSDARSAFEKFRHFGEEAGRLPATGAACPGPESDKRLTPVGLVRQRRAEGPERRWYTSPPRSLSPTEGTSPEALPQGPWRASFNMGELTRRQGHLSLSGGCGPRDGDDLRYQGICTKPAAPSARSPTVGFGSWASDAGPFYKSDCSTIKQDAAMALQAPLLAAVTQGDSAQVENILSTSSEDLRELLELRDERGRTPLHCAARHGHAEVCSVLLKRRADIHAPAGAGIAALALACLWRHGAVVRLLLKSRARPEQIDHGGQSAFHFACCNSPEIVHDFLQQNPDLAFLKDAQSRNPLFYAVGNNSSEAKMEILRMLLEAKCRASEVDVFGRSALHYAAQSGDMTTVEELQQAIDQEVPPCALHGELQVATNFADAALVEEDHSQEAAEAASAAHVSPFSDEHDKISEIAEAAPAARTVHGQREGETNDKAEAAAATAEEERKQSEVADVIEAAAIVEEELQQSEVAVETAATVEEERQKSDATNATEAVAAVAEEERQQSEVADVIEAAAIAQEERQQSEFAHATQRAATANDERQKTESAEVIEAAAAVSGEERQQSEAADSTEVAASVEEERQKSEAADATEAVGATAEDERQQNEVAEAVEAAVTAEEDRQKSEAAEGQHEVAEEVEAVANAEEERQKSEAADATETVAAIAEEERPQSEVADVIEAAAIAQEERQQSEFAEAVEASAGADAEAVETAATVEEERQKSEATNATEAVAAVAEEERQQSEVADVMEAAAIAQEERQQSEFAHATQRAATADDERQKTESAEVIEAAAATSGEERQQSEAADSTAAAAATAEGERQQNEIAEEVEAAASAEEDGQKSEVAGVMQTVVTAEDVEEGPSKDGATLELLASQVLSLDSLCQTHKAEGTEAEQAAARADEAEQERQMWEDRAGAAATVIGRHWKKRQTALSPAGSWKESLFLMLREEAAITDSRDSGSITYRGNIREGAENCWISFPGKYASAWKALTEENQGDSVACVFLCTKEDGLGVHLKDPQEHKWEKSSGPRYEIDEESGKITFRPDVVKDPKKPGERCYCHRIYGKRGFKQFGYYRELRRPFTSQRVQEETATAEAMNAAWVKEDAAPAVKAATRERARATWEEHGGIAAWGCAWFEVWFDRVTEAVSKHQRLKAVFFPGQEGQGVVPMDQLPEADLWDGIGCGGSQKSEIATVNHMRETEGPRWDYDEVSVAKFLHSEFADGCVVEGWCEEEKVWKRGILEHQEIEVRKVPREEDGVTRMVEVADVVFDIHCEGESGKLKTKDIRHVGRIMEDMMQECGLQNVTQSALECLKDMNIELLECSVDQWALRLDLRIQDIRSLQALRDRVLDGSFERELTQKLAPDQTLRVHVDKSRFFTLYEDSLQGLEGLTAHQQEKLEEMEGEADVHLSAPAGAGKTFVAMQRVLEALGGPTSDAHVLYVAPSKALLLFFLRWLAVRLTPQEDADGPSNFENFENALKRLSLLHHPYKSMILPKLQQGRIILPPGPEAETMFHLAVYDESHKIFGQEAVDKTLLNRVNALRRLFLSDEAQSSAVLHSFPAAKRVKLSEVVRSTERIVLAAAMFRYSSDENENVTSHGKSLGPPLKTFLFQPDQEKNRFTQYSKQIVAALWHAVRMFPNMSLHGRIAILVRDQHFRRQLYLHLQQALNEDLRHRRLQIVSFAESLLQLPERLLKSSSQPHRECIVLDSLENADGIEQLIVICVGLDEPLKKDGDQNFCSQLYRALTRAQLLAMVVNEHVQGGLLEFLGAVRFSDRKAARPPNCQEVVRKAVYENQASETGNADDEASEAAEAAATNMPADGSHVVTLFSDPDTTPSETDAAQPKPRSSVTSKAADARLLQAAAAEAAQMTDIWDTRDNAIPQVTTLQFNPMTQVCERLFLTTELPLTVEHHDDATSFHGLIRPHADACWISIPDHFEAAWKPVTELHHDQSVADVLFCDQESGLGQHFADPENPGKCYCARIYGERDYQRFGYLWTVDDEETRKGRAAEMAATQAVIVRSDATDETRERAQRMAVLQWMRCGKTASWGCAWFERWQSNVRKAVAKKQRLLVAFLPGQVGEGKVAMCDLPTSDLWDGIGLSAKQKVQVAIAEEMGWEYEAIDLVDLVRTAFPEGCLADGMDESGWWRLCKLGQMTFQDEKFSWAASSLNSGQEFKAVRVQHVGREILSLMDSVGHDYVFDFLCRGLVDTEVLQCEKAVAPRGGHALCITLQCSNSDALQKLGQKIMDGELERVLNTRLRAKGWPWPVQLDRTRFAKLSSAGDQDPFPGVSWQWFHRTGWRDYPRDVITQIEQAYRAGETKAHFQNGKRTGSEALEISFEEMLQRDPLSGDTREVKRAGPFEFLGLGDSEYEIVVDGTSGARLGITLDYEDGQTMVIDSIDEGLVKDWNEHAFSDTKVDIMDRIVEVNGIRGNIHPMARECEENK